MSAANRIDDVTALSVFQPLQELDHDKLTELAERSPLLSFRKGQPLAAGIEKGHIVYLLSGTVERSPNSPDTEIIKADAERAREPILAPGNRTRVLAQSNVQVLCVDAELLDLLLNWDAGGGFEVDEIDADESAEWLDTLMQSEAVLNLSPASIQVLMAVVEPLELKADAVIFNQGDRPDYYYIVSRGRCAITRRSSEQGAPVELATLGPGDAFGEEALIANTERSATVRMVEDGLLLRLDQQHFKKLLQQSLVHVVDYERSQSLKARGAVMLDLRDADEFAIDGAGINIPFAELRSRMQELERQQKYIVVSNDNRMSAVAAFLLGKQRFKVYVLQTSATEEIAERAAAATAQVGELRAQLDDMNQALDTARAELDQKCEENASIRDRIQALEGELKKTQQEAKRAILEAGSLKSKSEAGLRHRVNALSQDLDSERRKNQALLEEIEPLKEKLTALDEQLRQGEQAAEAHDEEQSLLRLRLNNLTQELGQARDNSAAVVAENDRLNGQVAQLTRQLQALQAQLDAGAQLPDRGALEGELETERQNGLALQAQNEQLQDRLAGVEEALQQAREARERDQAQLAELQGIEGRQRDELATLASELTELRLAREQAGEDEQDLRAQLEAAEARLAQQADALNEARHELEQIQIQAEQSSESEHGLHAELEAAEARLAQQADALNEARHALEQAQARAEQAGETEQGLRTELEAAEVRLAQQADALNEARHALEQAQARAEQAGETEQDLRTELEATEARLAQQAEALNQAQQAQEQAQARAEQAIEDQQELQTRLTELEHSRSDLEQQLAALSGQLADQGQAVAQRDALQHKVDALMTQLADKESRFSAAEAEFEQRVQGLETELNQASLAAVKEATQAEEHASRLQLRIQVLETELANSQGEKRRSGTLLKVLLGLVVLLGGALGVATYTGLDVSARLGPWMDQASSWLDQVSPWLQRLLSAIPGQT